MPAEHEPDRSVGWRIYRLRTARTPKLTQQGLAEKAGVSIDVIQKLEQGRKKSARLATLTSIATALGVDVAALVGRRFDAGQGGAEQGHATVAVDVAGGTVTDVYRRTFVGLGAKAALTVAAAAGISFGSLERRVDEGDIARLRAVVGRLRVLDQQHGSADLWDVAADRAHGIAALLECATYTSEVGAQMLELVGAAYTCAGWLATDAGRHDAAHGFYVEALSYADQAGSPANRVHALLDLALHAQILRRPRQMLRYVDAAERAMPADPPGRVPAVVLMRRGRALAMLGEKTESQRAFGAARDALDRDSRPPANWLPWFGHAEIDAVEGEAAVDLQVPGCGAILLERALDVYEAKFARNRALHLVRLSRARVTAGEIDGAAESTHAALDLLDGEVASTRVGAELRMLAAQLHRHRLESAVGDALERYRATPYAASA